jgi:hypothetical protein
MVNVFRDDDHLPNVSLALANILHDITLSSFFGFTDLKFLNKKADIIWF